MARIRTIKPEFPHSESMGNVSREARLLFILLWTLADDEGRLRGNSRILASLLYPYDDDAKDLMDSWISQLESESCISRYLVDNSTYIQIVNWSDHQKIDKPSKSKLPEFDEASRIVSKPREASSGDLDLEGKGKDLSEPRALEILKPPDPDSVPPQTPDQAQAEFQMRRCADYAIKLSEAGMRVTSMNPILVAWATEGYLLPMCVDALQRAKQTLKQDRDISPGYVDKILRDTGQKSGAAANVESLRRHRPFPS